MIANYEERPGAHPGVQAVWRAEVAGGPIEVPPDACWDIIWISGEGGTEVRLAGMMTATHTVELPVGTRLLGVRFKAGTYLRGLEPARTIDRDIELAAGTAGSIWLQGIPFDMPDYGNIDGFVDKLDRHALVMRDELVRRLLEGQGSDLSPRSVQRHFLRYVGLPLAFIRQVRRAEQAAALLQAGMALSQVAAAAGFADQAHMTREFRRLFNRTPGKF